LSFLLPLVLSAMDDFEDEKISMHELKQRAKAYYGTGGDGDGVLKKIEEILNAMFYDKPEDVFGHLVRMPMLRAIYQSVQFVKCTAQFRSRACAI